MGPREGGEEAESKKIVSHQHLLLSLNEDRITDLHSRMRSEDWSGGYSERGIAF